MVLTTAQKNKFTYLSLLLLAGLNMVFSACDKTPSVAPKAVPGDSLSQGMLIGSEGNFQWGNASLSFLDKQNGTLYEDVYRTVNQKPLGDVLQSMCIWEDKIYLVLNNSGKIEIVNKHSFKSEGSIIGLRAPRFMLPISAQTAYVSDLYDNHIAVVNLNTLKVSSKIACPGWTEEMLKYGEKVFVCNKYQSYLYVIDTKTNILTDSIFIGYGAISLALDKNNKLWVLTTGNASGNNKVEPQLHCLSPTQNSIEKTIVLGMGNLPIKLLMNETKDMLFWLVQDVWSMPIHGSAKPIAAFIPSNGRTFYGLGYDSYQKQILITDAKDYVQKSEILIYNENGKYIKSFRAGINTSSFLIK
jgi:hypothetical protein